METKILYGPKTTILSMLLIMISSFALGKFGFLGNGTLIMCPTQADYGFPFSFITHCKAFGSGKISYGFNSSFLIFDIIIWYVISLVLIMIYNKIKR